MGDPQTMGFNTKLVSFGMIWGYHHFRTPPYTIHKLMKYPLVI